MRREDVPDELIGVAHMAFRFSDEQDTESALAEALAAVLPEHEKQVRQQVAEEIFADVAALFAARVGADLWEAAYRAARIARGES